jgi:outer membrane beta-barrel protein
VHIVEKKQLSDYGRAEAVVYPVTPQINGKFTEHFGTAAMIVYHFQENFAFQVSGLYNWYSSESDFNQELINKVREQAQAATSLLLVWGGVAGVEVAPLYGKFAYYEGRLGHFSIVLNAGAGLADTRLQLRASNDAGPSTFGDAGTKFMGSVGGGFRVSLGERFTLRLEVRDLVYTARVDSVNGCSAADLNALYSDIKSGDPSGQRFNSVSVSAGCNIKPFTGSVGQNSGSCSGSPGSSGWCYNHASDVPLAYNLVSSPSSDVLNNVSFYAGLSFVF